MTRSSLLDVLGHEYVRTSRAKGLSEFAVVRRHALRSALLPVVTVTGLSLGGLLGGVILTETVFGLTGVGKTLADSITARDYGVVQGFALIVGLAFVLVNLLTDILYAVFDLVGAAVMSVEPLQLVATGGRARQVWKSILRSWSGRIGLALATVIVGIAVLAPVIAPYGPTQVLLNPTQRAQAGKALRPRAGLQRRRCPACDGPGRERP